MRAIPRLSRPSAMEFARKVLPLIGGIRAFRPLVPFDGIRGYRSCRFDEVRADRPVPFDGFTPIVSGPATG